jgi:transposase
MHETHTRNWAIYRRRERGDTCRSVAEHFGISVGRVQTIYRQYSHYAQLPPHKRPYTKRVKDAKARRKARIKKQEAAIRYKATQGRSELHQEFRKMRCRTEDQLRLWGAYHRCFADPLASAGYDYDLARKVGVNLDYEAEILRSRPGVWRA